MKKIILICGCLVLVIYLIIASVMFFNNKTNKADYLVDITNYNMNDIKDILKDYKISIIYIDSTEQHDTVLYTAPSANKLVYIGQEIQVYVSNGNETITYKNLINKYYEDNQEYFTYLEKLGVNIIIENQISNEYPDGLIINQSSLGVVKSTDDFIIKVNYNEPLIEIPDLINKTESYVRDYFKDTKIEVIFIYNNVNKEEDLVYYQSINANSLVINTNTKLYVYISI